MSNRSSLTSYLVYLDLEFSGEGSTSSTLQSIYKMGSSPHSFFRLVSIDFVLLEI